MIVSFGAHAALISAGDMTDRSSALSVGRRVGGALKTTL
jgi:hypothetical protein